MSRGVSRSTGMSSQTAVCFHQATRRIARRARMSSDGAMRPELLPGSERRSSTAARIGSDDAARSKPTKAASSVILVLFPPPFLFSRRYAGPPARLVGIMKTPGMQACSTRRSAVQRSTFVELAGVPRKRIPEAWRKIAGRCRFADLSAVASWGTANDNANPAAPTERPPFDGVTRPVVSQETTGPVRKAPEPGGQFNSVAESVDSRRINRRCACE
jgi:hypothetical protein